MKTRRIIASFLSLCMLGGTLSYNFPSTTISAAAVESKIEGKKETTTIADAAGICYTFDAETGTLTLKGNIVLEEIRGFKNKEAVNTITAEKGTVFPESCEEMFEYYSNCEKIDLSNVDTSNVTDMNAMFGVCKGLTSLDVSHFDTSNVTDMIGMFYNCYRLISLDLSNFDTSNVTDMNGMFYNCCSLTSLDVSNFDTSNVTDMSDMFRSCSGLTSLDLSNFDTDNVTNMKSVFSECVRLKCLTLGVNFKNISLNQGLPNNKGWVNSEDTETVISGNEYYAVFENNGLNTYYQLPYTGESQNTVKGDINSDGVFNVSDVLLFNKWLHGEKTVKITNISTLDLCEDGELDVFDLIVMKQELSRDL